MDEVLFCPFCEEAFEGQTHCPEHELLLLPWSELPRPERALSDDAAFPWYSPRFGRGVVAGGALLTLVAFIALPLAHVSGAVPMGGSMLRLALHGAPRLWLAPAGAWAALFILYRRRTLHAMRGARLALALVGCVPAAATIWTWFGARAAVELLATSVQAELRLQPGAGAYLVVIATLLMIAGGLGLGRQGRSDSGR